MNSKFVVFEGVPLWLIMLALLVGVGSCRTTEPTPTIYTPESQTAAKASLVSVLATGDNAAGLIVKTTPNLPAADWQLTAQTADGKMLTLAASGNQSLSQFTLNSIQATGLTIGQTYRFQLRFLYNGRDTLRVERLYRHAAPAHWRRLAHLDTDEGNFTGSVIPVAGSRSFLEGDGIRLSATRYVTDDTWQTQQYYADQDKWFGGASPSVSPRHGLVQFRLQAVPGITYTFSGLGFNTNPLRAAQRLYQNDMVARDDISGQSSKLVPTYAGGDGEIAFFTTIDRAFLLTQEASPALWVRWGNWDQYRGRDFPEAPGTMATFVLNGIGYVVNQIEGRPSPLYAYNPDLDQWTRRADFPGTPRSRGIGFSVGSRGYFGLGIAGEDEQGLRDIWQYDPAANTWQYVTEYPGQGNRYLVSYSAPDRAYLGWGYESQPSPSGGVRLVGCTDFWEFKP